jgi:hypothetical protein
LLALYDLEEVQTTGIAQRDATIGTTTPLDGLGQATDAARTRTRRREKHGVGEFAASRAAMILSNGSLYRDVRPVFRFKPSEHGLVTRVVSG